MTAPNFGDSEYPSAGERIGPAWQMMWDLLAGKRIPISRQTIIECVTSMGADIQPQTIDSLLRGGREHDLLERSYVVSGKPSRKRAHYRRTDVTPAPEGIAK